MFFKGSRYTCVKDHTITNPEGRKIQYKGIRFIPKIDGQLEYVVNEGERPDHLAFKFYKDPEQFWRICDTNKVFKPEELVIDPGRIILIPPVK